MCQPYRSVVVVCELKMYRRDYKHLFGDVIEQKRLAGENQNHQGFHLVARKNEFVGRSEISS